MSLQLQMTEATEIWTGTSHLTMPLSLEYIIYIINTYEDCQVTSYWKLEYHIEMKRM